MKARVVHAHSETNQGKLLALESLQTIYRAYVQECLNLMVQSKRHHVKPADYQKFFPKAKGLTSQIQKNARQHAIHTLDSWRKSLYQVTLKRKIHEAGFDDHRMMELRCVGKFGLTKAGRCGKGDISQEAVDLYWSWVWEQKTPVVSDTFPVWLSEMTCAFGPGKNSKSHGWWIAVSGLVRGKRIQVPLNPHPYLTDPATLAKSVLMRKDRKGRWTFQFADKREEPIPIGASGKVAVDVGLNVLAATSDGRLLGREFKIPFDCLHKKVKTVRANRQRQELKTDSKRLIHLEDRLTGQIKTATGTVTNQLVRAYPQHTFIVENLDLRGCRGSKRFAYRALQHSLERKAVLEVVNPAYTSQLCPSCGYVSRGNRNGIKFRCFSCGRVSHADVVGAINLLRRSGDKQIGKKARPQSVRPILEERFRKARNSSPRRKVLSELLPLSLTPTVIPDRTVSNSGVLD